MRRRFKRRLGRPLECRLRRRGGAHILAAGFGAHVFAARLASRAAAPPPPAAAPAATPAFALAIGLGLAPGRLRILRLWLRFVVIE